MLTKVAINRQNFNYQAFADLLENYENEFAKDRSSANYNCSDMSITLGDGFVVVNYLVSRNNLDGTRGPKQHRFMFVSGSLTFKNGQLSDFSNITMQQLLESGILSLTEAQHIVTDIDKSEDGDVVVLLGLYNTLEEAEKVAMETSTINIVGRNVPCDIALN